jgi:hypothetical protein
VVQQALIFSILRLSLLGTFQINLLSLFPRLNLLRKHKVPLQNQTAMSMKALTEAFLAYEDIVLVLKSSANGYRISLWALWEERSRNNNPELEV